MSKEKTKKKKMQRKHNYPRIDHFNTRTDYTLWTPPEKKDDTDSKR